MGDRGYTTQYARHLNGNQLSHSGSVSVDTIDMIRSATPIAATFIGSTIPTLSIENQLVDAAAHSVILYFEWTGTVAPRNLILSLNRIPFIHVIMLQYCIVESEIVIDFIRSFRLHRQLRSLSLKGNRIGPDVAEVLADGLTNMALRVLDVSMNPLGPVGIRHLAYAPMSPLVALTELYISGTNMGDSGLQVLCDGLASTRSDWFIVILDVSRNQITTLTPLQEMLCNGDLEYLNVAENYIKHAAINDIIPDIVNTRSLTHLNMSGMAVCDDDVIPLFDLDMLMSAKDIAINLSETGVSKRMANRFRTLKGKQNKTYIHAIHVLAISRGPFKKVLTPDILKMVCEWLWSQ